MSVLGYRVAIDHFHGPLDLLLYLIKSQEIDLHDIPVARVADQYVTYLETIEFLDINVASEFLVMAATLIELKSRTLLPAEVVLQDDDLADVEDPRSDLVRKLLEYKQFRDMAERLDDLREVTESRFAGGGEAQDRSLVGEEDEAVVEATLWDLLAAFQRVIREVALSAPQTIVYDDTPIAMHMHRVLDLLAARRTLGFFELFAGRRDRGFVIGTFLALLELLKLGAMRAEESPSGEIVIRHTAPDDLVLPEILEVGPPPMRASDEEDSGLPETPPAAFRHEEDDEDLEDDQDDDDLDDDLDLDLGERIERLLADEEDERRTRVRRESRRRAGIVDPDEDPMEQDHGEPGS